MACKDRALAVLHPPTAAHARIMQEAGCEAGGITGLADVGSLTMMECILSFEGPIPSMPIGEGRDRSASNPGGANQVSTLKAGFLALRCKGRNGRRKKSGRRGFDETGTGPDSAFSTKGLPATHPGGHLSASLEGPSRSRTGVPADDRP